MRLIALVPTAGLLFGGLLAGCIDRRSTPDPNICSDDGCGEGEPAPDARTFQPPRPPTADDNGMTWRLNRRFPEAESVDVGCGAQPGQCDPYDGDMPCDAALPLLCFNDLGAALPRGLDEPNEYHLWSGGRVRLSTAHAPTESITTIADADAICARELGDDWRLASFHDGWAWNFRAFGDLSEVEVGVDRFWVDITDQPNGTCWGR